ncbi:Ig-like domain-containing protein, partial [Paraglaciecola sp.]|uniref:Ig-like domain-containing protein n=1 Tax=Paraglaciecola sp. TaxID=1920173 RepID=UPI00273FAA84
GFNLEVLATNSAPNAADDDLTLQFSLDNLYQIDVLLNDSDPEDDALTITAANASAGQVSITDNKLMFTAPDNFNGTVMLNYSVSDGEFSDTATVSLLIEGSNPDAPQITVPADIIADATGILTKIDLGVATAVDAAGNRLAVSLDNGLPIFKPGKHVLYWRATDANGLSSVSSQLLEIHPLISVEKFKVTANNTMVTVNVLLNGVAPTYPVYVPYTVSGSALSMSDHDLSDGEFEISSGTSASISFNVFADLSGSVEKDIVISLDGDLNFAPNISAQVLISEQNLAPTLTLTASQQAETGSWFSATAGPIKVDAQVFDANAGDDVTLQWLADASLVNLSAASDTFEFDPALLDEGTYKVALMATDDANEALSITKEIYLRIVAALPVLGSGDSNNNLIPDIDDGLGDNNGNGIPNYLDNVPTNNILPQLNTVTNSFLLECDPGVRCGLGAFALGGQSGGAQILDGEMGGLNPIPLDEDFRSVGGIFDFVIDELPIRGQTVRIVIPQQAPIPAGGTYRKFQQGRWVSFIENANNSLHSAQGDVGYCPPPGAAAWLPGLIEGYLCVQLTIEDGGPNDDDGLVNNAVSDPGGVKVPSSSSQAPQAVADSYSLQWEQTHQLDVLSNDSDSDNDPLTINYASADFGTVEINSDAQSLWYKPQLDFIGTDVITYSISDGNGGTASASVTINVYYNRAPTIGNMTVTTNSVTSIDIAVLHTASDTDGDPINIIHVDAQQGVVTFNANNVIHYTPLVTFVGTDVISVQISDGRGGLSTAEITVKVSAKKSSGGSTSIGALALLLLFAACRRRNSVMSSVTSTNA